MATDVQRMVGMLLITFFNMFSMRILISHMLKAKVYVVMRSPVNTTQCYINYFFGNNVA